MQFLNRSVYINYSDYTTHYSIDAFDMPMPEELGFFRRSFEKRRFQLIRRFIPETGVNKILDAGSGSGWLAGNLTAMGYSVTAMDLGFDSIKRSKRRLSEYREIAYTLGDVMRVPFKDEAFDLVVMSEILEHLDSPENSIKEISGIVRKGGYLIISSPYKENIQYTLCIHCNEKTPVNAHLHSFDAVKISEMLRNAGFEIEKITIFGSRPAERLGFAGFTSKLPFLIWRLTDALFCRFFKRESYFVLRAVRRV